MVLMILTFSPIFLIGFAWSATKEVFGFGECLFEDMMDWATEQKPKTKWQL